MANQAERTFLKRGTEECSPHSFRVPRSAFRDYILVFAVAFCTIFGGGCSSWESFRERSANLKHELMDNGWEDPEAENRMARGEELFSNASYAAAIKEFKKVADNQSNHAEMSERARFLQGECRRLLGEWPEAVDTYHRLLNDFPTGHHRQEACARMYEIADFWLDDFRKELERRSGEKGILHWQPSWPNPMDKQRPAIDQEGRALEAMENIHTHDPLGPLADKALFWCGYVNFIRGNFHKSDEFFSLLVKDFRESPLRPPAISYAIIAKNNATGGAVYDGRPCAEALQLVRTAEATVPELTSNPEMADKLTRAKFAIRSQQAEKDFRTAEYYERTGHPGSAVFYYELVRRRFPGTRYSDFAGERKEQLLAMLHEGHPSVGNDPIAMAKEKWKETIGKKPPTNTDHTGGPYDPNAATIPAGGIPSAGTPQGGVIPGGGIIPGGVTPGSAGVVYPGGTSRTPPPAAGGIVQGTAPTAYPGGAIPGNTIPGSAIPASTPPANAYPGPMPSGGAGMPLSPLAPAGMPPVGAVPGYSPNSPVAPSSPPPGTVPGVTPQSAVVPAGGTVMGTAPAVTWGPSGSGGAYSPGGVVSTGGNVPGTVSPVNWTPPKP